MTFDIEKLEVKGDRVLVKKMPFEEKIGSFYVPENVKSRKGKRRADAWRAEVVSIGDRIDCESLRHNLKKGDIVYLAPVSLDCPAFSDDNGNEFVIVTQDDLMALEVSK